MKTYLKKYEWSEDFGWYPVEFALDIKTWSVERNGTLVLTNMDGNRAVIADGHWLEVKNF